MARAFVPKSVNGVLPDPETGDIQIGGSDGSFNVRAAEYGATGLGVADDLAAIQEAADAIATAGGGTLLIPDGTYRITGAIQVASNTKVVCTPKATILRGGNFDNMIRNKADGTTGVYGAASNITVIGGTWDANKVSYASNVCAMAFGHATNVHVTQTTIKNVYGWHFIEFNAVSNGSATFNTFQDFDATTTGKEMVQLDLAMGSAQFPWFGPYDNTPCNNIRIQNNSFTNGSRAIGSHSSVLTKYHTNIRITDNYITTMREEAIYFQDWQQVIVSGNEITDCWFGLKGTTVANQQCKDFSISRNILTNMKTSDNTARGINFSGIDTANRYMRNINITGNILDGVGLHGIGTDYCDSVTINNNTVAACGGAGIWFYRSTNGTVNGNTSRGNSVSGTSGLADLNIGGVTGGTTDTTNVVVNNNNVGSMQVNVGSIYVIEGNIMTSSYTVATSPAPTNVQKINNFIAGTWTP